MPSKPPILSPAFILRNGVLYVPAWEWDSTRNRIMDIPVRTRVAMPIPGRWSGTATFHFENQWHLTFFFAHDYSGQADTCQPMSVFDGLTGLDGYLHESYDREYLDTITAHGAEDTLHDAEMLLRLIHRVAGWQRWTNKAAHDMVRHA